MSIINGHLLPKVEEPEPVEEPKKKKKENNY